MGDLKDPRWMYLKAILFLLIIIMCAGTLWMQNPQWQTALLIVLDDLGRRSAVLLHVLRCRAVHRWGLPFLRRLPTS